MMPEKQFKDAVATTDRAVPSGVTRDELSRRGQLLAERQVRLSCVVPIMNEAAQVQAFIQELAAYLPTVSDFWEIIVVDDGSTDDSLSQAQQALSALCANDEPAADGQGHGSGQAVALSRNFGKEAALSAGLQVARGEVVVLIDGDFQHPFATIADFLAAWGQGYDHVYGIKANLDKEFWLWRWGRGLFHKLIALTARLEIPHGAGDFRLLDKKVVAALNQCTEQDKFMKGLYSYVGFRGAGVRYNMQVRRVGQSHFHAWRLTRFAASGFLAFSSLPLRIWGVIGFVIALCSFISASYIVISTLVNGARIPGYATLLVVVVFFGGVQLLSIGVLGEYIARIFREVKPRPAYLVQQHDCWGKWL